MEIEKFDESEQLIELDNLLEILGNPTRRVILSKLAKIPHSAPELASSLGISRQAVHSQLKVLSDYDLIENVETSKARGDKFKIKSNLSVRIDITPHYYNVKYTTSLAEKGSESIELNDLNCSLDYSKIKTPDAKIKFLGEQLINVENNISRLEIERRDYINQKECIFLVIKDLMNKKYKGDLERILKESGLKDKNLRRSLSLTDEILFTVFFNPERYFNRFNINKLLDDLFFADMDRYERGERFGSIRELLGDMSKLMSFFHEDEDNWFFDF